ncbi:NAC domain-containing protein [Quillaja saponaria]|uniref:NAC domain-containing protein n=1 Tax=Quillaja saponaria TaxID=32244 RepID=A0AAD7L3H6_QUISA|nr:NAC domain-containing protein [Quillaja saponaria]
MSSFSLLPPGFRFQPTEQELLLYYLYNKITSTQQPQPPTNIGPVFECDLYGDKNPWEIWESFKNCISDHYFSDHHDEDSDEEQHKLQDLYFFTKLKRKTLNGSRFDRKIGSGSWEGEDASKPIMSCPDNHQRKQRIGSKKRFRFEKSGTKQDGRWIMIQYSLDCSLLAHQVNDYVLCRLKKNDLKVKLKPKEMDGITRKRKRNDHMDVNVIDEEASCSSTLSIVEPGETSPCPNASVALGLKACDWVPKLEDVVKCLGLVLDENFSSLVLHSEFHEELRSLEGVIGSLTAEARHSCPVADVINKLNTDEVQGGKN